MYNRVFWDTLGRAQDNNYRNQIKKKTPLKQAKASITLIFKVLTNNYENSYYTNFLRY